MKTNEFTDDDLKRLKEGAKTLEPDILGLRPRVSLFPEELLALIARLEAAEKALLCHENRTSIDCTFDDKYQAYEAFVKAWRKAAGK